MKEKVKILMNLLELNEAQAVDIVGRYLKDVKDIHVFLDYYFETCMSEKIIGSTYEKLRIVCKIAQLEFKERFENKESFLKWLFRNYKSRAFFRLYKNDFTYEYFAYDSFKNKVKLENSSNDCLICINGFKELTYHDGSLVEDGYFKEALIDFMFKNQHRVGKDLSLDIQKIELKTELCYQKTKEEEKILHLQNLEKFSQKLKEKTNTNFNYLSKNKEKVKR
ncbi:hypothetical protein FT848_06130 [Campylobacter lari]|nr:hypothetical protein [Campylobacter lari]EAI4303599.1 hypothetical protein [Campylobacter lari]EAK0433821.1 hypothetical protein [Campylobacter lari]EAK0795527.1 hypothetical protein [Campylobacter lari]EAK0817379.1 hypothetical protein [Campylobacter lari]